MQWYLIMRTWYYQWICRITMKAFDNKNVRLHVFSVYSHGRHKCTVWWLHVRHTHVLVVCHSPAKFIMIHMTTYLYRLYPYVTLQHRHAHTANCTHYAAVHCEPSMPWYIIRQPDINCNALRFTVELFRQPDVVGTALSFTAVLF